MAATRHVTLVLVVLCHDESGILAQRAVKSTRNHKRCAFDQPRGICPGEPMQQDWSLFQNIHHISKVEGVVGEPSETVEAVLGKKPSRHAATASPSAHARTLTRIEAPLAPEPHPSSTQMARADKFRNIDSSPVGSGPRSNLTNTSCFGLWQGVRILGQRLALSHYASQVLSRVSAASIGNLSPVVFVLCFAFFAVLVSAFLALTLTSDSDPGDDETLLRGGIPRKAEDTSVSGLPERAGAGVAGSLGLVGRFAEMPKQRGTQEQFTSSSESLESSAPRTPMVPAISQTKLSAREHAPAMVLPSEISTGNEVPEGTEADILVPYLSARGSESNTCDPVLMKVYNENTVLFEARLTPEVSQRHVSQEFAYLGNPFQGGFRLTLHDPAVEGLVFAYCRLERPPGGNATAVLLYHYSHRFIGKLVREHGPLGTYTLTLVNDRVISFAQREDGTMRVTSDQSDWMEVIPIVAEGIGQMRRVCIGELVDAGLMLISLLAIDWLEGEHAHTYLRG